MTLEFLYAALILSVTTYLLYKIGWRSGFDEGVSGTLIMLSKEDHIRLIFDSDGKITHILPHHATEKTK